MTRANLGLSAILLLAALQRIVYLAIYPDVMPFFAHPLADARIYESWSSAIAAGDFWSRGEGVFYRAPLYPYMLSGIRWIAGHAMPAAAWIQSVLGLGTLVLTARVGARMAGPWAGVCAAGLLALYGPLLACESKRLPTTLGIFLHTASLLLALRMLERPSARRAVAAGSTLGLSALVRPQWLLLAPLFTWISSPADARRSFFARAGVWYLAAAAALVIVVTARNYWIGAEWVPISSNGGMTFYQGNNPENRSGLLAPAPEMGLTSEAVGQREGEIRVAEQITGEKLGPGSASRFWFRRGLAFIVEQPRAWLTLELKKLGLLIRSFEYPDNYSFFAERARVWPLWLSPLPFGALFALAVAGATMALRDKTASNGDNRARINAMQHAPQVKLTAGAPAQKVTITIVLCSALAGLLACLLFYVSSRYRLDAAPALAILGGVALARWLRLPMEPGALPLRKLSRRGDAGMLLVAGAFVGISFWPVGAGVRSQESMSRLQMAVAFDANDQPEEAARAFAEATSWYPENLYAWRRRIESVARHRTPQEAKSLFAQIPEQTRSAPELQYMSGILSESEGDFVAAEAAYRTALAPGMELPEAAARLAGLRARAGAFSEAESLLAVATPSPSAPPAAWLALAEVRVRLGNVEGARHALQSSGMGKEEIEATLSRLVEAHR